MHRPAAPEAASPAGTTTTPSLSPDSWSLLVLVLLSLINIWPVLWFKYLPFMDHPSHLLQYNVLAHHTSTLFGYDRFYAVNLLPAPNLLNDYLTAMLAQVFSVDFASRLTIASAMGLLPVTLWFYLSKVRPGTQGWAFLAVPLVWSRFLTFGNENFCVAIPFLFLFLGLLADWKEESPTWRRVLGIAALCIALYFAHFLVFAIAGLAMVLHWGLGKWSVRSLLQHALPLLPGSLFFVLWSVGKGSTANSGAVPPWKFEWLEKFQAIVQGTCPAPWDAGSILWICFVCSLLIFMSFGGVALWRQGHRFPVLLTVLCWGIALCLQRWTLIFIPDQRMWWISVFLGLALLPTIGSRGFPRLVIFAFPLVIGTSFVMGNVFQAPNKDLAAIDAVFAEYPTGLRLVYFGDPSLPPHLHRAFEYYHIRKGGRSTMQFVGNEHSVKYKEGGFLTPASEPGFTIYDYTAEQWLPYLDQFDGALIIGRPTEAQAKIIALLKEKNFRQASQGTITLMLSPNWQQP